MVAAREDGNPRGDAAPKQIGAARKRVEDPRLRLVSPRDGAERASQVSYSHPESASVMRALGKRGVIGDVRAPDILRFGFAPLYTRYVDVWNAVDALRDVLLSRTTPG